MQRVVKEQANSGILRDSGLPDATEMENPFAACPLYDPRMPTNVASPHSSKHSGGRAARDNLAGYGATREPLPDP